MFAEKPQSSGTRKKELPEIYLENNQLREKFSSKTLQNKHAEYRGDGGDNDDEGNDGDNDVTMVLVRLEQLQKDQVDGLNRLEQLQMDQEDSLNKRKNSGKVDYYYAPNFEDVGGAYCFWDVCACVRPSVRYAF